MVRNKHTLSKHIDFPSCIYSVIRLFVKNEPRALFAFMQRVSLSAGGAAVRPQ